MCSLHLDEIRGNSPDTPTELGIVTYPHEFVPFVLTAVAPQMNFPSLVHSESAVHFSSDAPRSRLINGLEQDTAQRADGQSGLIFPEGEKDIGCKWSAGDAPLVSVEVQLADDSVQILVSSGFGTEDTTSINSKRIDLHLLLEAYVLWETERFS